MLTESGSSFVGRISELAALRGALSSHHLVSVVGPGGSGKTRLVREVIPPDAVVTRLAAISQPTLIASAILEACGVAESVGVDHLSTAVEYLAASPRLIVLDNCEHLLTAVRPVIATLLEHVPVLVTSRIPIGVEGEHVIRLTGLQFSDADSDAVALFNQRAALARPGWSPTDSASVVELCMKLDGLPLALELAAARANILNPAEILERISDNATLTSAHIPDPALHETIAWSYDLLDEAARKVLVNCSVFAGGFDLAAAEAVGGHDGTLDAISKLADHSLLVVEDSKGRTRYLLLETIRTFASKLVDDNLVLKKLHASHYATVALEAGLDTTGPGVMDMLDADRDNLRSAIEFAIDHEQDTAVVLVCGLWRYWLLRAFLKEGARLLARAIAVAPNENSSLAGALNGAANIAVESGEPDKATALYERSLKIRVAEGDLANAQSVLMNMGVAAQRSGDLDRAREYYESSLKMQRQLPEPETMQFTLLNLGSLYLAQGKLDEAREMLEEVRDRVQDSDPFALACTNANLGITAGQQGMFEVARTELLAAITTFVSLDMPGLQVQTLEALSLIELMANDYERSAILRLGVDAARMEYQNPRPESEVEEAENQMARLRDELSDDLAAIPVLSMKDLLNFALSSQVVSAKHAIEHGDLRLSAGMWTIRWQGTTIQLQDMRGIGYIARLLETTGQEIHVLDLVGAGASGDSGPVLDDAARNAYRRRMEDLRSEAEVARDMNDDLRAERAEVEIDALTDELSNAFGLGRHVRKASDDAERARKAATNRIKATIRKLGEAHPALGRHLSNSVRTGVYCIYAPDRETVWTVVR